MADAALDYFNRQNQGKQLTKKGFSKVSELVTNHANVLQGVLTTGVIAGINQLVDNVSFKCPCLENNDTNTNDTRGRVTYGFLFMFGPAALLLVVGIFLNQLFWKNLTGCCQCKCCCISEACPGANVEGSASECCCCSGKCDSCSVLCFFQAVGYGFLAFFIWCIISLADGDFLACALTDCVSKNFIDDACQCVSEKYYCFLR